MPEKHARSTLDYSRSNMHLTSRRMHHVVHGSHRSAGGRTFGPSGTYTSQVYARTTKEIVASLRIPIGRTRECSPTVESFRVCLPCLLVKRTITCFLLRTRKTSKTPPYMYTCCDILLQFFLYITMAAEGSKTYTQHQQALQA
jgi:hypothetical protein